MIVKVVVGMDRREHADELDRLWEAIPAMLEEDEGWALREVLDAGIAGYTREDDTPEGLMIRFADRSMT